MPSTIGRTHGKSKASIIIPCWNQAQYLPDAIESAIYQTYPNVEIIVVNDGSPDNTSEVAKEYPEVILVEQENRGLSGARNAGIKRSTGDYILTLDADDEIHSTFIEKTIGVDDICGTWQKEFGDSNNVWKFDPHPTYELLLKANKLNCCSLFKREVWKKTGGYDENMREGYEDWDFWLRAAKAGFKITIIQEVLFFYRKHGRSMINEASAKHDKLYNYILSKHYESKNND